MSRGDQFRNKILMSLGAWRPQWGSTCVKFWVWHRPGGRCAGWRTPAPPTAFQQSEQGGLNLSRGCQVGFYLLFHFYLFISSPNSWPQWSCRAWAVLTVCGDNSIIPCSPPLSAQTSVKNEMKWQSEWKLEQGHHHPGDARNLLRIHGQPLALAPGRSCI